MTISSISRNTIHKKTRQIRQKLKDKIIIHPIYYTDKGITTWYSWWEINLKETVKHIINKTILVTIMSLTFDALIKGYWLYISKGYQISTHRKIPIPQSLQIIQISQNPTFINIHNRGRHHYYIKQWRIILTIEGFTNKQKSTNTSKIK